MQQQTEDKRNTQPIVLVNNSDAGTNLIQFTIFLISLSPLRSSPVCVLRRVISVLAKDPEFSVILVGVYPDYLMFVETFLFAWSMIIFTMKKKMLCVFLFA